MSVWIQKTLKLKPRSQGCYLITDEILSSISAELKEVEIGMCNLLLMHSSAGIILCENYDQTVRNDMLKYFNKIVPEGKHYEHDTEGPDDMPAHIKCALTGVSINVPISKGKLAFGTWQGVWLMEYRTAVHHREMMITINGKQK